MSAIAMVPLTAITDESPLAWMPSVRRLAAIWVIRNVPVRRPPRPRPKKTACQGFRMLANAAALWVATWLFSGISLTGSDTLDPFGSQQPCRVRVHLKLTSGRLGGRASG